MGPALNALKGLMMSNFSESLRHGFSNLTNVEGRDRPRQYWPYALLLIGTKWVIGTMLTLPVMISSMEQSFDAVGAAARSGAHVDQAQLQAQMMQQMMGQMQSILPFSLGLDVIIALLLCAATVRRLHDRNWSGWWVMLAVASMVVGAATSYWTMSMMASDAAGIVDNMGMIQLVGWLPLVGYIVLLVQLVQGGTPGPNRFGEPPEV